MPSTPVDRDAVDRHGHALQLDRATAGLAKRAPRVSKRLAADEDLTARGGRFDACREVDAAAGVVEPVPVCLRSMDPDPQRRRKALAATLFVEPALDRDRGLDRVVGV